MCLLSFHFLVFSQLWFLHFLFSYFSSPLWHVRFLFSSLTFLQTSHFTSLLALLFSVITSSLFFAYFSSQFALLHFLFSYSLLHFLFSYGPSQLSFLRLLYSHFSSQFRLLHGRRRNSSPTIFLNLQFCALTSLASFQSPQHKPSLSLLQLPFSALASPLPLGSHVVG